MPNEEAKKKSGSTRNTLLYVGLGLLMSSLIVLAFLFINQKNETEALKKTIEDNERYERHGKPESESAYDAHIRPAPATEDEPIDVEPIQEEPTRTEYVEETAPPARESIGGSYNFTGTMGKNIPIRMNLYISGSIVTGSLNYPRMSKEYLSLDGNISGRRISLSESDDYGTITGYYEGYLEGNSFSGNFYRIKNGVNDKTFSFKVSQ